MKSGKINIAKQIDGWVRLKGYKKQKGTGNLLNSFSVNVLSNKKTLRMTRIQHKKGVKWQCNNYNNNYYVINIEKYK